MWLHFDVTSDVGRRSTLLSHVAFCVVCALTAIRNLWLVAEVKSSLLSSLLFSSLIVDDNDDRAKENFTLEQATKAQKGIRGIALLFL